jgi:hypothetical protein
MFEWGMIVYVCCMSNQKKKNFKLKFSILIFDLALSQHQLSISPCNFDTVLMRMYTIYGCNMRPISLHASEKHGR